MKTAILALAFAAGAFAGQAFRVQVTGSGQPMILIPGLSSSGETWETTTAHYKDRFECHVLTLAGFAGVPRVDGPFLDTARDAIAAYIREKKLVKPVIAGHSLGGYLALAIASKYPDLTGKLVIVDSYPQLAGIMNPGATAEQTSQMVDQICGYMRGQSQEDYLKYVKSGVGTRSMVAKDSDFERIKQWGVDSDRTAVGDAMCELFRGDLREAIAAVRADTLVLGSWIGYKQYTDRERTLKNLKTQYAKIEGVRIELSDTANHFIMWDDPAWMFRHMDRFLGR